MSPAKITHVVPLPGGWLRVWFADGAIMEIDAGPLVSGGGVFERIDADLAVFEQVHVDGGGIAWPGEVDICPDVVYGHGEPADGTRFERRIVRPASTVA